MLFIQRKHKSLLQSEFINNTKSFKVRIFHLTLTHLSVLGVTFVSQFVISFNYVNMLFLKNVLLLIRIEKFLSASIWNIKQTYIGEKSYFCSIRVIVVLLTLKAAAEMEEETKLDRRTGRQTWQIQNVSQMGWARGQR